MVFVRANPIKTDDLGMSPISGNLHIYTHRSGGIGGIDEPSALGLSWIEQWCFHEDKKGCHGIQQHEFGVHAEWDLDHLFHDLLLRFQ